MRCMGKGCGPGDWPQGPGSVIGGDQDDFLAGGEGNDTITGGPGRDTAHLGVGDDMYSTTLRQMRLDATRCLGGAGDH